MQRWIFLFLSFFKYDINIVLETWKGTEPDFAYTILILYKNVEKRKNDQSDSVVG